MKDCIHWKSLTRVKRGSVGNLRTVNITEIEYNWLNMNVMVVFLADLSKKMIKSTLVDEFNKEKVRSLKKSEIS